MAASLHSIPPQRFLPLGTKLCSKSMPKPTSNPQGKLHPVTTPPSFRFSQASIFPTNKQRPSWGFTAGAVPQDLEVVPVRSTDSTDRQNGVVLARVESDQEAEAVSQVGGFGDEARLSLEGAGREIQGCSSSGNVGGEGKGEVEDVERFVDKAINATVVLAAGSFAITKLLTIDHDYWHGWTIFEILRYAPQHNWSAYEEALKANPVFAKMMISGIVYSIGDWIAQCVEGRPLFDFDRARMFRSGLVGFTLHGSISHYYYQFCEALFPFHEWWVVPAKVAFDQTLWAITWNSIYYAVLGFLRLESPASVFSELKATSWPMLTAGWKLWPFAHVITYGVVPVEQRLLWVDCVELIWVTILSTYSNAKSKARVSEAAAEMHSRSISPPEE